MRVEPQALTVHATHLDRIADGVDTARQAGQHVRLGADAYGQLCAFMPSLLDGLQRTLVGGVDAAAGSLRDTAGKLRVGADRYRASDSRASHRLRHPEAGR
ncbi:type VII secretion target [Micromonospora sp. NPDC049274]|uniref:type VII secretion target n=1 Tax=Micromonospora sp. NPDC049274 TaxID=3154829 RepID=UPI003447390F